MPQNKLLLHTCCAPCTFGVLPQIPDDFETMGFFYNPNIYPAKEHRKRKDALNDFSRLKKFPVFLNEDNTSQIQKENKKINIGDFSWTPGDCEACYRIRLTKTADYAKHAGFTHFSTTLLISPYQKHDIIKEVGRDLAEKFDIEFYYKDFRPGFHKGKEEARQAGIYVQKYCGCIKSKSASGGERSIK